jgi:hypothetical protein
MRQKYLMFAVVAGPLPKLKGQPVDGLLVLTQELTTIYYTGIYLQDFGIPPDETDQPKTKESDFVHDSIDRPRWQKR